MAHDKHGNQEYPQADMRRDRMLEKTEKPIDFLRNSGIARRHAGLRATIIATFGRKTGHIAAPAAANDRSPLRGRYRVRVR